MKAPDFKLSDETGKIHSLSDYKGQNVLLYFYPKDMTPGCTVEAQCFRDRLNDLKALGVQVLGVSADSIGSHQKFKEKHHLNFPLLADTDKEVIQKYGVWKEKSMYGKKYMGISRESFLIDREGMIVKHYAKVTPAQHVEEVLKDAKKML
jgi:peroxiredoxin Q/BCP